MGAEVGSVICENYLFKIDGIFLIMRIRIKITK
jgi:hypothetical protein